MPKYNFSDVFVLAGAFDLRGSNATEFVPGPRSQATEEIHGAGDTSVAHASVGLLRQEATQRGIFDDDVDKIHDALRGLGSIGPFSYGVQGLAQGQEFTLWQEGIVSDYVVEEARETLTKAAATYKPSGRNASPGDIIEGLVTQVADGVGPSGSLDNLAGSSAGGLAVIHVPALTLGGFTSVTLELEESSNDGAGDPFAAKTPAFANLTGPGSQVVVLTGVIEQFLRANITFNGAGSSESLTYFMGVVRF